MIFIAAFITALIWHFLLEKLWLASLGSTLTAVLITVGLFAGAGHLNIYGDEFYIEILQLLVVSFAVSVLVGFVFKLARSKSAEQKI